MYTIGKLCKKINTILKNMIIAILYTPAHTHAFWEWQGSVKKKNDNKE